MGVSRGTGVSGIPTGQESPEAREIPKSREFPGNSRMGNSLEGKVGSHTGGWEREFPVEHPWLGHQSCPWCMVDRYKDQATQPSHSHAFHTQQEHTHM